MNIGGRYGGLQAAGPAWRCASFLIALGVLAPVLTLAWLAFGSGVGHWGPLFAHVLPQAALNTALLLAGVGTLVLLIGTGCAWLVTAHDFPGRGVLHWALLLPLAMPTYIVAFAYLDLLHPIGPVQGAIRWMLGFDSPRQFRLPDLRSMPGAIFVLGFVLYPYVYMTARAMFMTQPAHLMEAARMLGESRRGAFFRVALPLARPALAVGLSLALLETLNDIGASEFLGVNTLTVAVYTTWITRSDLAGAAQIACAMLFMVVALVWLERSGRRHQRFGSAQRMRAVQPRRLRGGAAWAATAAAALPVLIGFVAPALYLVWESAKRLRQGGGISQGLLASLGNTLALAAGVTVAAVAAGLVVAWAARTQGSGINRARWQARVATLGYAVPGTVLAIGLLTPALAFDAALATAFGWQGLPLMAAGVVLVVACTIRFLAMPVGGIEAGLSRIPPAIEQASRLLGETTGGTLRRVHLPLLRPALAAGALLVFVDAMKELPATLLLRPANFDTLATWLYAEAARGTYEEGAIAALAIVLAGLLPVVLLARNQLGTPAATFSPDTP
ncbi:MULTISPECIES: ABC transporter permease [Variovorax]|jgi:iron(III) transport system permease protein|uniref:ABC transporter permease n=1 Tax=Variovorax TaxID=34072 RepID=UPI00086E45FE|nr:MULTISPECIES: iron ABC transporter permease [Variovorax]MBN8758038.1 iron ABC transporter permease [Variovorax sp.]ODU13098.1 MAG: iron ABC transporter permease [Variovorax sp. SCN 67-85]ODV21883.1 MAG: iron ABC transporter permease [Variovorax sp. SCN 67-20]OJZ07301.1 MAG: iron ABC transporter permease [Variovorax sp. 67-131]UKI10634.1 iron ABC transporter permease [Variovorax paradoxus]